MPLLPDAESFRRLVEGSDTGVAATVARGILAGIAVPYGLAVACRNAAYDRRWLPIGKAGVPVISVGNLTLGGTGKTPLVAWVARAVAAAGLRPAIVSRGYAAEAGGTSDEAAELGILLPDVPHLADRDRVAGSRAAAAAGADIVVLDDGFQHRRLARDLDLVAIDATDPFGCGRLFPRGLLREPMTGICRADAVILTRASAVEPERRAAIRDELRRAAGGALPGIWAEASHSPRQLRTASGGTLPIETLSGLRIAAFAGIGNPAAFRGTLERLGAELVAFRAFPDHHHYQPHDLASLEAWLRQCGGTMAVTTLKDLVKIRSDAIGDIPLTALEIALSIDSGADNLHGLLAPVIARARAARASGPR